MKLRKQQLRLQLVSHLTSDWINSFATSPNFEQCGIMQFHTWSSCLITNDVTTSKTYTVLSNYTHLNPVPHSQMQGVSITLPPFTGVGSVTAWSDDCQGTIDNSMKTSKHFLAGSMSLIVSFFSTLSAVPHQSKWYICCTLRVHISNLQNRCLPTRLGRPLRNSFQPLRHWSCRLEDQRSSHQS